MVRKIPIFKEIKVKYSDVYHMKNLYVMLHEYLYEEGWWGTPEQFKGASDYVTTGHLNLEKLYLEKFVQKGLARGGKEMWIWWRAQKFPESKFSGYLKYKIDLDWHMAYTEDIEVMHQGKKMKVQKGEIEFFIRPYIETDYNGHWENHWFLKHFQDTYERRFISGDLEKKKKELWREAYKLQGVIKRYLNLRTFVPTPEPFHPAIHGYEGEPATGGRMPLK